MTSFIHTLLHYYKLYFFRLTSKCFFTAYLIDTTGDGKKDAIGFDTNHDGKVDHIDANMDGHADKEVMETDFIDGIRVKDGAMSLHHQLCLTRSVSKYKSEESVHRVYGKHCS